MVEQFATTKWSLLFRIKSGTESESEEALDALCRNYWLPLYGWLRGKGNSPEDAQDLTQGFFAQAIRRGTLAKADAEKGRLRSFLLACLKNYLADVGERERAQVRVGRKDEVSLDFINSERAESGLELDLKSPDADPSQIFERRWARAILNNSLVRLREEYAAKGKEAIYEFLSPLLSEMQSGESYATAAAGLKTSEGAARIAFHRLKIRFREVFREEVAMTLLPDDELSEEMQYLASVLE